MPQQWLEQCAARILSPNYGAGGEPSHADWHGGCASTRRPVAIYQGGVAINKVCHLDSPPFSTTETVWRGVPETQSAVSPAVHQHVDCIIVGAGITGLTAGLKLLERGVSVTLIDQNVPASGTTGRSSAHLTALIDTGLVNGEKQFSVESNRRLVAAMRGAIDQIEQWTRDFGIAGFARVPAFYFAEDEKGAADLSEEVGAAGRAGLAIEAVADPPLPFPVRAAYRLENQAIFDPALYVSGLVEIFTKRGGHLLSRWRVGKVEDGTPCRVETDHGELTADSVILATHTPIGRSILHGELKPARSYLIAAEIKESFPNALFWDTASPYHYMRRVERPGEPPLVLLGGADHQTGKTPTGANPYDELEQWLRARFPIREVTARWSAQLHTSIDGYPFVGRPLSGSNIYVATGYAGDGLTLGTAAGGLLADMIAGRPNDLESLFLPSRIPVRAAGSALGLNLSVAKHLAVGAAGNITPAPGEGSVHRSDHELWADYREPDGTLHRFSARCPHMGCILQWNALEKTWDCPCHGGRFSPLGKRLEGPPRANMRAK